MQVDQKDRKKARKSKRKETAMTLFLKTAVTLGGDGVRDPAQFVALLEEAVEDLMNRFAGRLH